MARFPSLRTPAGGAPLLTSLSPVVSLRYAPLHVLTDANRGAPLPISNSRIISPWLASRPYGRQPDSIATDIAQPGRIATLCSASRPVGRQPGETERWRWRDVPERVFQTQGCVPYQGPGVLLTLNPRLFISLAMARFPSLRTPARGGGTSISLSPVISLHHVASALLSDASRDGRG